MNDSDTATIMRDMIAERQRLLNRKANYLRGLLALPPVDSAEAVLADGCEPKPRAPARFFDLTPKRRAAIAAVAGCIARGEDTTYGTLRIRSGVAKRTFARVLAWAVGAEVVTRTDRGYLPGRNWAACVEGDAALLGLPPPRQPSASQSTTP